MFCGVHLYYFKWSMFYFCCCWKCSWKVLFAQKNALNVLEFYFQVFELCCVTKWTVFRRRRSATLLPVRCSRSYSSRSVHLAFSNTHWLASERSSYLSSLCASSWSRFVRGERWVKEKYILSVQETTFLFHHHILDSQIRTNAWQDLASEISLVLHCCKAQAFHSILQ